jgi:hypothetical protein
MIFKDRLFYSRFELSIGFYIDEASCLRELTHEAIDSTIERRRTWQEIAQHRWKKSNNAFGNILSRRTRAITDTTVENLHNLAEVLLTSTVDFKLVVSINHGYVYTNDQYLIDQLADLEYLKQKTYTQAVIARPKNTIELRKPRHKFRSYFNTTKITAEQKSHLVDFLKNQTDVRTSPSLTHWLDSAFHRTQDYFFIDYNHESWLTMLGLVRPGLIRKTMQIIQAK